MSRELLVRVAFVDEIYSKVLKSCLSTENERKFNRNLDEQWFNGSLTN